MVSKHPHCIDLDKVYYDSCLLAVFSRCVQAVLTCPQCRTFLAGSVLGKRILLLGHKRDFALQYEEASSRVGSICAIPLFVSDRSVAATTPRRGIQLSILDVRE